MLEVLKFIFQDFWHWLGTLILVCVVSDGISGMFKKTIIKTESKSKED